ncbi:hypothetical protein [Ensifer adhaerens]|nr:hypothetical protein [Ensifer adhaerens]
MNRIAKLSVIAALSALSFGGVSFAAGTAMNWPALQGKPLQHR